MLLKLPNYINGEFKFSGETKTLHNYKGEEYAVIYNTPPLELRIAKRNITRLQEHMRQIPLKKILKVIATSMKYYFEKESEFVPLSQLTGSPLSYVKQSIREMKEWAKNLDEYLFMCFGVVDYKNVPITYKDEVIAYEKYLPPGPVVGVLPRNSEAESLYLLVQILLAQSPFIIKPPSSLGSSYSSLELVKAINKALDELKDPQLEVMRKTMNIINVFSNEQTEIIKKLEVEGASYVVFGSNKTIERVSHSLEGSNPKNIIKMGTGLSMSIVLEDADISLAAREICTSAALDRGNDCVSTNIVYLASPSKEKFLAEVEKISSRYESKDPFLEDNMVGHIHHEDRDKIIARLSTLNKNHHLKGIPHTIHLSTIHLEEHDHFEEFPGPVLGVRSFEDKEELFSLLLKDLKNNNMDRNLVTSVFTKDKKHFEEISTKMNSYTFKLNKGSQKMNFLLEHQGMYLIKELLDRRILEQ